MTGTSMGVTPNKSCRSLCVLLVLMVCNCYFSLLSSEADVKLQDRMSTCPVVKLRGLASSKKRSKKVRRLTLFEAYVWLSVMIFNQLLRSLIARITTLLLRAGDVELNPGPTPPTSSTPDDSTREATTSIPSDIAQLSEASNTLSNPELEIKTPLPQHQIEAQQATFSQDLPTEREVIVPALHIHPDMAPKQHHFLTKKDESPRDERDNVGHPPPEQSHKFPHVVEEELQPDKSLAVKYKPFLPQHIIKDTDSYDDDLKHHHDFGELRRVDSCMSLNEFKKVHSKQITKTVEPWTVLESEVASPEYEAISEDDNSWTKFMTSANKLLRAGIDCEFCPMCFKKKQCTIGSHIFPRGLLTVYKRIHCSNIKGQFEEFIYDFSRGVKMGSRALRYPMLCNKCERVCDEESLRRLYIFLMDKPKEKSFKVPNANSWLQRVLANIMYRGLIIADNLPNELQDPNFKQSFKDLRKYCQTGESLPPFQLFLLPNQAIDDELIAFIYPFEYILRSPMFSIVVRNKRIGINFIYTKFDCFHLVLPFDGKSKDYFNHFQKGFETYEHDFVHLDQKYVKLRWTMHGTAVYKKEYDKITNSVKYCAPEQIKPAIFPEVLLKIALDQYTKYLSMIYTCGHSERSGLTPHCKIMIEYLPGLDHEYPSKDFSGATAKSVPQMSQQPDDNIEFPKSLREEDLSTMIKNAAKISPLGLQQRKIDERSAEIELISKKLKKKEGELKDMKKVMTCLQRSLESAESAQQVERRRRRSLEVHLAQRDDDIQSKLDELLVYEQRLNVVHLLLYKERRELNRCRLENAELRKQSKTVEKNLRGVLVQISDDLKELLPQDTTPESACNKLLQRCQKMLTIIDTKVDVKRVQLLDEFPV